MTQESDRELLLEVRAEIRTLSKDLYTIVVESNKALSNSVTQMVELQKRSLPISLVFLMFLTLLAVLFGKECIEWFFGHPLTAASKLL